MVTVNGIGTSISLYDLVLYLKDYMHKLEVDDIDPQALKKMKNVQEILDELQEVM